jgi:hypothetical protein
MLEPTKLSLTLSILESIGWDQSKSKDESLSGES